MAVVGIIEGRVKFGRGEGLGAEPGGSEGLIFGIPFGFLGRVLAASCGRNFCISIIITKT